MVPIFVQVTIFIYLFIYDYYDDVNFILTATIFELAYQINNDFVIKIFMLLKSFDSKNLASFEFWCCIVVI